MSPWEIFLWGSLASLFAGLATGLGALPALWPWRIPPRALDAALGFAAGVMLAASAFGLVLPGIGIGRGQLGLVGGTAAVLGGLLAGALVLGLADRWVPHEMFVTGPHGPSSSLRRVWLILFAMTLHNFPEGLAVGVGFGGAAGLSAGSEALERAVHHGATLAIGIGLQNVVEGLAAALAVLSLGGSRRRAAVLGAATGLVEPVGGLVGAGAAALSARALPFGMGFAAGAMIAVVLEELVPEMHGRGNRRTATIGAAVGFSVMTALDVIFG